MDGYPSTYSNGATDFDSCGYEDGTTESVDTRNVKFQAKINHQSVAASSKSFNYKTQMKYLKRKQEKMDREAYKEAQGKMMKQMQQDNEKWKAVDDTDSKHMQKQAEKRQKEQEKAAKKKEQKEITRQEEEKVEENGKKQKKQGKK